MKVTALALDCVVEAVELEGATFAIRLQFHPERLVATDKKEQFVPIFETLKAYGAKNKK